MNNSYFKLVPSTIGVPLAPARDIFPFDTSNTASAKAAYSAAAAAQGRSKHGFRLVCWLRPSTHGVWSDVPELAPPGIA